MKKTKSEKNLFARFLDDSVRVLGLIDKKLKGSPHAYRVPVEVLPFGKIETLEGVDGLLPDLPLFVLEAVFAENP